MVFVRSLDIIGSALSAERYRTDIILQNIANSRTTRTPGGVGPYVRQQMVFEERPLGARGVAFRDTLHNVRTGARMAHRVHGGHIGSNGGVRVRTMVDSINEFRPVYDPYHPDADEDGYVIYPNVDTTEEIIDLMGATNAYEANLSALNVVRAMINRSLDIGK